MTDGWGISCKIALRWMPRVLTGDKSTLNQVMAWCRQATSHYMSQCWPRFMSPYGVTMPQRVNDINLEEDVCFFHCDSSQCIHVEDCCQWCSLLMTYHTMKLYMIVLTSVLPKTWRPYSYFWHIDMSYWLECRPVVFDFLLFYSTQQPELDTILILSAHLFLWVLFISSTSDGLIAYLKHIR